MRAIGRIWGGFDGMTAQEDGDRNGSRASRVEALHPGGEVASLLAERMGTLSRAERKIASHILDNVERLHLETGASIARATGVSEMTVGRFVRALGFANLKALKRKAEAEQPPVLSGSGGAEIDRASASHPLHDRLQADLDAVAQAHALAAQQNFRPAIRVIERATTVHVLGFPAIRGLAFDLASRLLWLRPGVVFLDVEQAPAVVLAPPARSVLVLIDAAPFDRRARQVARRAVTAGLPLVVISEGNDPWPWEMTPHVFQIASVETGLSQSRTGLQVMAGLVLEAVAEGLGQRARSRYLAMLEASRQIDASSAEMAGGPASGRRSGAANGAVSRSGRLP